MIAAGLKFEFFNFFHVNVAKKKVKIPKIRDKFEFENNFYTTSEIINHHDYSLDIYNKFPVVIENNNYQDFIRKESLNEAERLAYVAFTRAKKQLIVLWANAAGQEGNPLSGFLFGSESINLKIEDHTKEMMEKLKTLLCIILKVVVNGTMLVTMVY